MNLSPTAGGILKSLLLGVVRGGALPICHLRCPFPHRGIHIINTPVASNVPSPTGWTMAQLTAPGEEFNTLTHGMRENVVWRG